MNQDKVRKHKDEATRQLAKGRIKEALDELLQIQKLEPQDLANRQKVGDLYIKLNNKAEGIKSYQAVAGAYAADGLLLKAIAVCKLILQLDPNHTETQRTLADLYGKKRGDSAPTELPAAMAAALPKPAGGGKMSASMIRGVPATQLPMKNAGAAAASHQRATTGAPPPPPPDDAMPTRVATGVPAAPPPRTPTALPPTPPPPDEMEVDAAQEVSAEIDVDVSASADDVPVVSGQAIAHDIPRISPHGGGGLEFDDGPPARLPTGVPAPARTPTGLPPPAPVPVMGTPVAVGVPVVPGQAASWGAPAPVQGMPAEPIAAGPAGPADLEDIEMVAPPQAPAPVDTGPSPETDFSDMLAEESAPAKVDVSKLPPIPLFSDLSKNAFIELMERMDIKLMTTGEAIVNEGEVGNSFFIIASGQVHVEKKVNGQPVNLATLNDGAFFGEMALLSDAPRTASVVADSDGELFEISREVLDSVIKDYPSVQQVMMKFYKQRLLSNLLNTSPIFSRFDKAARKQLIEMFRSREVAPDEDILTEGQKGDGLYVVLSGRCNVFKNNARVAELKEGDVFGEMSLLTRDPVSASIRARTKTIVLRLPRKQFNEVIMTHPQVLELISEISAQRLKT